VEVGPVEGWGERGREGGRVKDKERERAGGNESKQ